MNSTGRLFRVSIYGESHGKGVGVIMDGVPAGISLDENDFKEDLNRRKPGKKGTTTRVESDLPNIMNGVFNGTTTGAPLHIFFENNNKRSKDYSQLKTHFRPGHADFVADKKYKGFQDYRGGGHFSGRLTVCLVACGVVAKKILPADYSIKATLVEAGGSTDIEKAIQQAIENEDSIGGVIECRVNGVGIGLGEPFFDSVESKIAHLVFAVPATKGVEFGSGFRAAKMKGSEHNDLIINKEGETDTNNAGGINGGISNGNEIIFRVPIKPTSSIHKAQDTYNAKTGKVDKLEIVGRHDVCIALRAPVVIEAVAAIALADLYLINKAFQ